MLALLCLFMALIVFASFVGVYAVSGDSRPTVPDFSHTHSQQDAQVIARLGNMFNSLPNTVMIETKLSSIRHSQAAQTMLAPLCRRSGMNYGDLISTIESKFAKVDRKVFNLIKMAEKMQGRSEEPQDPVEESLEPWLASMKVSPQRISQLVEEVEGAEIGQDDAHQKAEDPESQVEEEEEEVEESIQQAYPHLKNSLSNTNMLIQDLSRSHEMKYQLLFENLDALTRETNVLKFLEKFTEINEFLNAYIGQLDAQITQLRKVDNQEIYARLSGW